MWPETDATGSTFTDVVMSSFRALLAALLLAVAQLYGRVSGDVVARAIEIGLEREEVLRQRSDFERTLVEYTEDVTYYEQRASSTTKDVSICARIAKNELYLHDSTGTRLINCTLVYNSSHPLLLHYDVDSSSAVELVDPSWHWLPSTESLLVITPVRVRTKQMGLSYLRLWIHRGVALGLNETIYGSLNATYGALDVRYVNSTYAPDEAIVRTLGFPLVVLRDQGVTQLLFRITIILMVTLFTFTMGCELDAALLKSYFRRPIGPAIGFACQFIIMPSVALAIAKLVPIKREFGFGLLVVGCSPGGGASNAWSLMLGGDINLSILMTFLSSLCSLFMMPFLLFLFGRFFIDTHRVWIPYGNICAQLLQVSLPALLGLGTRYWKPKLAKTFTKLTRPFFIAFIIFILTFGLYAHWAILRLLGSYPIVMPTGAMLPWIGFSLSALICYLLRQPRSLVITVALETGIQNVSVAILVLLYSMPQPAGDLGAVMPITVSIFTPIPLCFIWMAIVIKRRWSRSKPSPQTVVNGGYSPKLEQPLINEAGGPPKLLVEDLLHSERT
ncbi:unnamed protein product [Dicrocoelium dendriticum]|nr:unnamed protein product [Dicrocoelium dendriticum]